MKKLVLLGLFSFLTGCLGTYGQLFPFNNYQDSTSPRYAQIRFLDTHRYGNKFLTRIYSNTMCMKHDSYKGFLNFNSPFDGFKNRSLGMPVVNALPNVYGEFKVTANEPMIIEYLYSHEEQIGFSRNIMRSRCNPAIRFVPQAGKNYEASFIIEGNVCRAILNEIVKNNGRYQYVPANVLPAQECKSNRFW